MKITLSKDYKKWDLIYKIIMDKELLVDMFGEGGAEEITEHYQEQGEIRPEEVPVEEDN